MASVELEKFGEETPPSPSSSASTKMAGSCLRFRRQWAKLRFKMKKLFGRKPKDEEPQADSSLGRNNSRPPQSNNPYAQNADPYANNAQSYAVNSQSSFRSTQSGSSTAARPGLPSGLPSGPRPGGLPRQQPPRLPSYDSDPPQYPSSAKTGSGYGDAKVGNSAGYGDAKVGNSAGYGSNRYNAGAAAFNNQYSATSGPPSQRPGGYGGLDESPQTSQGSAPPRYSPPRPSGGWDSTPNAPAQPNTNDDSRAGRSYGYGEARELTEEEQEEAEVDDTKRKITEELKAGNQSLGNALAISDDLVSKLGGMEMMIDEQGDRFDRIERNLNQSKVSTRIGLSGVKELNTLAKTPFFIPAMSNKKKREQDQVRMMGEQQELDEKEQSRLESYGAFARKQTPIGGAPGKKLLGARSTIKDYSFEDTTGEQEELVLQGDDMMDRLDTNVSIIKSFGTNIGTKIDAQNKQAERLDEKTVDAESRVRKVKMMVDGIN